MQSAFEYNDHAYLHVHLPTLYEFWAVHRVGLHRVVLTYRTNQCVVDQDHQDVPDGMGFVVHVRYQRA